MKIQLLTVYSTPRRAHQPGEVIEVDAINNPEDPSSGTRKLAFTREVYIEQDDFNENPPPQYFRLAPGREVRLRAAYFVKYEGHTTDDEGNVTGPQKV